MTDFLTDSIFLAYVALVSLSYLIGSIPMGLVLGKLFKVGDIRQIGSGNIGATNALRTGNKAFAISVLIGDAMKGVAAIALAYCCFSDTLVHAAVVAGLVAVIGHIFPVWLRFKGGKGIATSAGVILMLHWPTGICCLVMWLVCARLSRYSSLSAVLAAINLPLYAKALDVDAYALPFAVLAALVLWTHRANISRLARGEESTIKLKKINAY